METNLAQTIVLQTTNSFKLNKIPFSNGNQFDYSHIINEHFVETKFKSVLNDNFFSLFRLT
jgi:hypothetical protein